MPGEESHREAGPRMQREARQRARCSEQVAEAHSRFWRGGGRQGRIVNGFQPESLYLVK